MNKSNAKAALKPLLRWAGGKRKILPTLLNNLPPTNSFRRYVEPFVGGGAFFLAAPWPNPILSDANCELMNFYSALAHRQSVLLRYLKDFPPSNEKFYYELRAMNTKTNWVFRAARFYYLNRYCFNGLYRENTKGLFNVPFNSKKNFPLLNELEFLAAAKAFRRATMFALDFRKTLTSLPPRGSFAYLDPPYFHYDGAKPFRKYTKEQFNSGDHEELADILKWWDKKGGLFLLSNAGVPKIDELYLPFYKVPLRVRRWISCNGQRKFVKENLIANYPIHYKAAK